LSYRKGDDVGVFVFRYIHTMKQRQHQGFLSGRTAIIIIILILLAAILFLKSRQQQESPSASDTNRQIQSNEAGVPVLTNLELPASKGGEQIVVHTGYTLSYNEEHEIANWVAYKLTKQQTSLLDFERTNNFKEDPKIATGTADDEDYQGSGYDRGHLVPAEDMAWSATSMKESFYYSNMTPQVPAFNRGVWRRLEELTRFWASYHDSIFIVTGPVLTGNLPTTGRVSVPEYFYKAILEYNNNEVKAIGFLLPNKASSATLKNFALPVDSIEKLTGLDLFPKLPDDTEQAVESDPVISEWPWTRKKKGIN
jgi:endonuclease G, mitochondrial